MAFIIVPGFCVSTPATTDDMISCLEQDGARRSNVPHVGICIFKLISNNILKK